MDVLIDLHFFLLFPLHLLPYHHPWQTLSLPFSVHLFLSFHLLLLFLCLFALLCLWILCLSSFYLCLSLVCSFSQCLSLSHLPSPVYHTPGQVPFCPLRTQPMVTTRSEESEPEPLEKPWRRSLPTTLLPSWTSRNPLPSMTSIHIWAWSPCRLL